jgi:phosphopantothenoylcysteine decarboxylase/phosphopantothenate--cysteine ligase
MDDVDIYIGTAAVADYRPETVATGKIKKDAETLQLTLIRNPDILASVKRRYPASFCVGFAAETDNLEHHARNKLHDKGVDMIAANWVGAQSGEGGFGGDDNALRLVWREGELELPLASKTKLARELVGHIAQRYQVRHKSALTSDNILRFNKPSDNG